MFRHFLVPTDGSELAQKGVEKAIELAAQTQARITAFHVAEPVSSARIDANLASAKESMTDGAGLRAEALTRLCLNQAAQACAAAGVACSTDSVSNHSPAEAIAKAAQDHGCDLIVIASHGRTGLAKLMLGSQTQHLLSITELPVLVVR